VARTFCGEHVTRTDLGTNYRKVKKVTFFFHWLYSPLGPWPLIFQCHHHFTDGRTPWTSYQLVARPLPKHRTTQTQNKHIPNIHALCGIRTHDPGFRASEDSTCPRPFSYRERQKVNKVIPGKGKLKLSL
jgi:hypothetical protein